jgi:hypothetical protein
MTHLNHMMANEHRDDLIRAARHDSLSRAPHAGGARRVGSGLRWPWSDGLRRRSRPLREQTAMAPRHDG